MYKKYYIAVAIALFFTGVSPAYAAISAGTPAGSSASASSLTLTSFNATGTTPYLLVGVIGATSDVITTVAFNGSNLTQLSKQQNNGSSGRFIYIYGGNVTAATANIVVSSSGADFIGAAAVAYDGVVGTDGVHAATTGGGTDTVLTSSITTTVDNDWISGFAYNDAGGVAAGTNTTVRGTDGAGHYLLDTNAAQTPAGAHSIQMTMSSGHASLVAVALSPDTPTPPPATTTTATTTTIDNPNQDFTNGVLLFLIGFFGMIWLFGKRR